MLYRIRHILLLTLLFFTHPLRAQTLGIVMSGGGAKGLVHIGVLKALEENHIPIDYITGTSIGAIIGSMYACGYTIDEITKFFQSPNFHNWSTGDFSHEAPSFYKLLIEDAEIVSAKFHIGKKTKLILPTNLIPPYPMDFALLGIYAQATAAAHSDLNQLMLPFRALSTNAYDKQPYAPRHGDLGTLVRASMSFPGLYKPTLIDSLLLFDGGLIDNFPIDIMQQEFNPDLILGSNCSYNYQRPQEDDVLSHIYALVTAASHYQIPSHKGWMLNFDSINIDLLDWDQITATIEMGYRYAARIMPQLKQQMHRTKSPQELNNQRSAFKSKLPPLTFNQVHITGATPTLHNYAASRMTRPQDHKVQPQTMRFRFFDAASDGGLLTLVPQAAYNPHDSSFNLHLRISPAPNFKAAIGGYFSSATLQSFISFNYNYYAPITLRAYINAYWGTIYSSQKSLLRTDFRSPRLDIPLFIEAGETLNYYDYYANNAEIAFSDTRPDFLRDRELFGFFNIGTGSPHLGAAMRLGLTAGRRTAQYYPTTDFTSTDIPEHMQFTFIAPKFNIEANSLNFKTNPTQGIRQYLNISYIYGREHHTYGSMSDRYDPQNPSTPTEKLGTHSILRLSAEWTQYLQIGKYLSLGYHAQGAYSTFLYLRDYYANLLLLPAFEPLQHTNGLFLENFRSSIFLATGIIPTYVLPLLHPNLLLRSELYAFLPFAELSKDNVYATTRPRYSANFRNIYFIGSLSAIYQLPFANISFSITYYDRSRTAQNSFFYNIGIGYYLKNSRAFY